MKPPSPTQFDSTTRSVPEPPRQQQETRVEEEEPSFRYRPAAERPPARSTGPRPRDRSWPSRLGRATRRSPRSRPAHAARRLSATRKRSVRKRHSQANASPCLRPGGPQASDRLRPPPATDRRRGPPTRSPASTPELGARQKRPSTRQPPALPAEHLL